MTNHKFDNDSLDYGFPLEIKAPDLSEAGTIAGYASTFGNTDRGGDIVLPGAFRKSIQAHHDAKSAPVMLWQHRSDMPIGRWTAMREDSKGLRVEGKINLDVQAGREAHSLLKSGAIGGLSIGFMTKKADRDKSGARRLVELDLHEISVVSLPMNPAAQVTGVKSLSLASEIEQLIRARGFPRSQAKAAAHVAFKALCESKTTQLGPALLARIEEASAALDILERKIR